MSTTRERGTTGADHTAQSAAQRALPQGEAAGRGGDGSRHGKTVAESRTVMARSMQPPDANVWGNVHGGAIMRMVDECGGAVAVRHSRSRCVTVTMDSMTFKQPVYIGDLLTITAQLTYVGRSSMEVEAQIEAEDMRTGIKRDAGTSHLIYVAIDDLGRPTPVPPLILTAGDEQARWQAAERRRSERRK